MQLGQLEATVKVQQHTEGLISSLQKRCVELEVSKREAEGEAAKLKEVEGGRATVQEVAQRLADLTDEVVTAKKRDELREVGGRVGEGRLGEGRCGVGCAL